MVGKEPTVAVKKQQLAMPTVPLMPGGKAPSTLSAPVGVSPQQAEILADELKKEGNQLYNDGQLEAAEMVYSEAIKVRILTSTHRSVLTRAAQLPPLAQHSRNIAILARCPHRSTRPRTTFSSATDPCAMASSADLRTRSQTPRRCADVPLRCGEVPSCVPRALAAGARVRALNLRTVRRRWPPLRLLTASPCRPGGSHDAHMGERLRPPRSRCGPARSPAFLSSPKAFAGSHSSFLHRLSFQHSRLSGRTKRRSPRTRRPGGSPRRTTTTRRGSRRAPRVSPKGLAAPPRVVTLRRLAVPVPLRRPERSAPFSTRPRTQEYVEAVQALKLRMSMRDMGGYSRIM